MKIMFTVLLLSTLLSCGGSYEDRSLNSTAMIEFSNDTLLKTRRDSTIYSIGYILKPNIAKIEGLSTDEQVLFDLGMKHAAEKQTPLIDKQVIASLIKENNQNSLQEQKDILTHKAINDLFFEENKKKKGVVSLKSGLQYKIIESGKGQKPSPQDTVSINYICMLISSNDPVSAAENYEFSLEQGIEGWKEVLQLMKPGDKWIVYVPYYLGYGNQSAANGKIPAYAPLVFRMELNSVKKKK